MKNDIIALIGERCWQLLCEVYPGQQLYIPMQPSLEFTLLLGHKAAYRLCRQYGGYQLHIPSRHKPKKYDIIKLLTAGRDEKAIACELGVSIGYVRRFARKHKGTCIIKNHRD